MAINLPIGIHGSIKRILTEDLADQTILAGAPAPKDINFDERPAQKDQYPSIAIFSEGTSAQYTFEASKSKVYRIRIEVFALSLNDAELLCEAIERSLESGTPDDTWSAVSRIASMTATDPDGIVILDEGGERYSGEANWSPSASRTHMGTLRYSVEIRRSFRSR